MITSTLRILFCAMLIAVGASIIQSAPASAVTCYGDYCSGQDPVQSGCAASARTIFTTSVYGTGGASYVNVRWSDVCKTNWAQSNVISSNIKAEKQNGYTQGYSTNNGSMAWSRMIYSPVDHVRAVIWGGWGTTATPYA